MTNIPPGAASTFSDLLVWIEEKKPDYLYIPKDHPLTCIREFNAKNNDHWTSFHGLEIKYEM